MARLKVEKNDRVMYQGQAARVLTVKSRTLEIRDAYGYVRIVKRSECEPYRA